MKPHTLAALVLTMSTTDFRKLKKVLRTLGSMGVYDFDSIVEQAVLGLERRRQESNERAIEARRSSWDRQHHLS